MMKFKKVKFPAPGEAVERFNPFNDKIPEYKYVAFIDVLGFGSSIRHDFGSALTIYQGLIDRWRSFHDFSPDISVRIISDSIILTSSELGRIVSCVNILCMITLAHDLLVRGGIAFGKHIENYESGSLYVLSEALTEAVYIEKEIKHPCVAFSKAIEIPQFIWELKCTNVMRPVLHFEGFNLVNPFNELWGQSASQRVLQLLEKYPKYRKKYEWFLYLYKAVFSTEPLIP